MHGWHAVCRLLDLACQSSPLPVGHCPDGHDLAQVAAMPLLARRSPAREAGKENYGALNLQPSAAPARSR
jgi:hypothetical protein